MAKHIPDAFEQRVMKNLKRLRERCKLTQKQLAEAAGVSEGAIRNWEQGIRAPGLEVAEKLADELDCLIDDLIGRRRGRRRTRPGD